MVISSSSYLSPEILGELVWALQITLGRVSREEIENPDEAQLWLAATSWLDEAERALAEPDAIKYLTRLNKFPLSSAQLRKLQQTVDRLAAQRESRQPAGQAKSPFQRVRDLPILTARDRIRASWNQAHRSSFFVVAGVLLTSVAATIFDATILRNSSWELLVGTDAILTLAALVVWLFHYRELREHRRVLVGLHLFDGKSL